MYKSNKPIKFLFASAASLVFASLFSACGGGGGNSAAAPQPINDDQIKPGESITHFTRLGIDILPDYYEVGQTDTEISATGGKVTFAHVDPAYPKSEYNFTFDTGFAGGVFAAGGMIQTPFATMKSTSTNSSVYIAAPAASQQLQNVFWIKLDDPYTFGFHSTGYLLDPDSYTWPSSGTATYVGTATEYILNAGQTNMDVQGYALYTAPATATVDYAAKTIAFNFSSKLNFKFMSDLSYMHVADLDKYGFSFTTTELDLTGSAINYDHDIYPVQVGSSKLYSMVETLGFFGKNAENLGGTMTVQKLRNDLEYGVTNLAVGFALVRQ